ELKTKPTQHSVKDLLQIGIQPDILLCRTDRFLSQDLKRKIGLFCNVEEKAVITAKDVEVIYDVPMIFHSEGLDDIITESLNIWTRKPQLDKWTALSNRVKNLKEEVTIGVVGKYVNHQDAYKSLHEALAHGGFANNTKVQIKYVDSEDIENEGIDGLLSGVNGILVPGGFGKRGFEGKIDAITYARTNNVPFFGICLGMQMALVEYSRNVCSIAGAHTIEYEDDVSNPVVHLMEDQKSVDNKGGTMRLGAYPCIVKDDTIAFRAYKTNNISERHRHRYEVNNKYRKRLEKKGLIFSGVSPDENLVEMIEIKEHPWFLGCQFHPEFKSTPLSPHPLFVDFIKSASQLNN
ncbi:MAG: CTP synthase, partial [Candidatus Dadabacteria bacterium]|nr:CTP synthase [Candidatus Dadabacteria bacterium]